MKYCTGCGKDVEEIKKGVEPIPGYSKSVDKEGHTFYNLIEEGYGEVWEDPTFYECNRPLTFCEKCGQPLKYEDIKTFEQKHDEGRAEVLISGYKCSSCGFGIDY